MALAADDEERTCVSFFGWTIASVEVATEVTR